MEAVSQGLDEENSGRGDTARPSPASCKMSLFLAVYRNIVDASKTINRALWDIRKEFSWQAIDAFSGEMSSGGVRAPRIFASRANGLSVLDSFSSLLFGFGLSLDWRLDWLLLFSALGVDQS